MFLARWLRNKRRPESPIPEAAQQVSDQADELRRLVEQLRRANNLKGRHT